MKPERRLPHFRDETADYERFGFESFERPELPGTTWGEGNMFDAPYVHMPNCDMDKAIVADRVWQYGNPNKLHIYEQPEHEVLVEIFYNDAVRRLQAIEQLTLPPKYTTIPNTGAFSRTEHIWGSVLFARQMSEKHGITGRDAVRLQLRTLVSDIAHTFGSHLGDWMFQGVGGPENQHDLELKSYLEAVGIGTILRRHGYTIDEVVFPDIEDWIEASQPDLCVDRVDYGLREMNRWNDEIRLQAFSADDFTITSEGMLAMENIQRARIFSEGFLLLSQEHWSEPTHRFMIDMLMLRTKLFYAEGKAPSTLIHRPPPSLGVLALHDIHPRDLMYVTDPAQDREYAMPDLAGHTLEAIMKSVATYRRQYVWPGRRERISGYMQQFTNPSTYADIRNGKTYKPVDCSDFDSYRSEYPAALPTGFAIMEADEAESTKQENYLDFPQPPFKTRQIDPFVRTNGGFRRLSEIDPSYKDRLAEHKHMMTTAKVARVAIADRKTLRLMQEIAENVETGWRDRLETSRRMTPEELSSLVSEGARNIHGQYPFMTFFQY